MPENYTNFVRLLSSITNVETIAEGSNLRIRNSLKTLYGDGNWRKMKGVATIEMFDGRIVKAEVHWYEAHGIGKRDFKWKYLLDA